MPDVLVVGGGIIGAACAQQLAADGAMVTLIERAELAAGASGRNAGLWAHPIDPALTEMARVSLSRYLELAEASPLPYDIDRVPLGLVLVALDEHREKSTEEAAEVYRRLGLDVDELDSASLRELEPAITPSVEHGFLIDDGYRLDPALLTVALALIAIERGAEVRHHLTVRSLARAGERVIGVVTDDGRLDADHVVLAAGPWSAQLLEPLRVSIPIVPVRGWLVRLETEPGAVRHLVEEGGWRESSGRSDATEPILAEELADQHGQGALGLLVHPWREGGALVGSSRQAAVTPEPEDPSVPLRLAREAIRLMPALAGAPVLGSWWGLRPMSPDERPIVGAVADGLVVATGHGSEGVILGAGTAQLVAAIVAGTEPPFDPVPFSPARFER